MSSIWKINGTDASTLGIKGLSLTQVNQAPGEFSFLIPGNMAASIPYPYKSEMVVTRGSTCWFRGVVITKPRSGTPRKEYIRIRAQDCWWWLDNITFEQDWAVYASGSVVNATKARCILGRDKDGNQQTNGQVIREALEWAIGSGAPIQIGTIDPAAEVPATEDQDITCSQVIQQMLRWSPDAVCYWTHSGSTPVFNCRYRRNLSAATMNINAGAPNSGIEITSRPDLVLPAVVLKYEQTHSEDNRSYSTLTVDKYPADATGREVGAFVGTVNLAGRSVTYQYQDVLTEPIKLEDDVWWQKKFPWMADTVKYADIYRYDIKRSGALCPEGIELFGEKKGTQKYTIRTGLKNELIDGQVLDWMQEYAGEETITLKVDYAVKNEDGTEEKITGQDLSFTLTATDATTRKYWRLSSYVGAETPPSGLAQALYQSCSDIHYEGQRTIVEDECSGTYTLGQVLNIAGGLSEWSSMRALIQSVTFDFDRGYTTVNFGPPEHLGFYDLVELLKVTRNSRPTISIGIRETGDISSSDNTISGGQNPPRSNSTQGPPQYSKFVVRNGEKAITLDPAAEETELTLFTALELQADGIHTKQRTLKLYGTIPYEIGPEQSGPTLPGGPCSYGS